MVLAGDEACSPAGAGHVLGLGDLPAGPVGVADVADLAAGDEVFEGRQRLIDGRQRVRGVELVEVDPVGAKPAQRGFRRLDDVAAGSARAEVLAIGAAHVHAELRADDGVVPAGTKGPAEHRLAEAGLPAVGVRDVKEGDPGVEGRMHDGVGAFLRFSHRPGTAQVVAPKSHDRDGQSGISHAAVFSHGFSLYRPGGRPGHGGYPAGSSSPCSSMASWSCAMVRGQTPGIPVSRRRPSCTRCSRVSTPACASDLRAGAASPAGSGVLPGREDFRVTALPSSRCPQTDVSRARLLTGVA